MPGALLLLFIHADALPGFGEVYVGKLHGLDVAVKKLLVNPTMVT